MAFCLRSDWRTRLRRSLGLALVVGLAAGVALGLAAGARRTTSSYDRLVEATRPADLEMWVPEEYVPALAGFATVADVFVFDNWFVQIDDGSIGTSANLFDEAALVVPADAAASEHVRRAHVVSGRLLAEGAADEVSLSFELVDELGVAVGETVSAIGWTREQSNLDENLMPVFEAGTRIELRVVGIHTRAGELPPRPSGTDPAPAVLSPAFAAAHWELRSYNQLVGFRFVGGRAGLEDFRAEFEELAGFPLDTVAQPLTVRHDATRDAVGLSATALWLLAAMGAGIAVLLAGQGLVRQVMAETGEWPPLESLGMTSGQLVRLAVARSAMVAAVAAAVAVVVGVALSPLFPVGLARTVEVDLGPALDPVVLLVGVVTVLAVMAALTAVAARRELAARNRQVRGLGASPLLPRLVSRAGVGPSVAAGVSLALETRRGPGSVPLRSTVAGAVVTFAALAAALSFGASLDHLLRTPSLSGIHWDVQYGDGWGDDELFGAIPGRLRESDHVAAITGGTVADLQINGMRIPAVAGQPFRGGLDATVVEGRAPMGPDELFLGADALRSTGLAVGHVVDVRATAVAYAGPPDILERLELDPGTELFPTRPMRIVGSGVTPEGIRVELGTGALLTMDGLRQLSPHYAPLNLYRLSWADDVDPDQARAELHAGETTAWMEPSLPEDLANFGRARGLPWLVAGLMGAVGVALLSHLLVTTVRRRQRDLALLKTLGLTPRQVSQAVVVQASVIVGIAALVGLPVGVAVGRWSWTVLADDIGVLAVPVAPLALLGVAAAAALAVANAAAAFAAHRARRAPVALVLRTR